MNYLTEILKEEKFRFQETNIYLLHRKSTEKTTRKP